MTQIHKSSFSCEYCLDMYDERGMCFRCCTPEERKTVTKQSGCAEECGERKNIRYDGSSWWCPQHDPDFSGVSPGRRYEASDRSDRNEF